MRLVRSIPPCLNIFSARLGLEIQKCHCHSFVRKCAKPENRGYFMPLPLSLGTYSRFYFNHARIIHNPGGGFRLGRYHWRLIH